MSQSYELMYCGMFLTHRVHTSRRQQYNAYRMRRVSAKERRWDEQLLSSLKFVYFPFECCKDYSRIDP